MSNRYLMALGAGLAAGVLFILPAKGMMAGVWLSVLAPMPLMIAVLGYGWLAGLAAAVVGAGACALMQPALSIVFLISTAGPALLLGWLATHVFAGERQLAPGDLLAALVGLAIAAVWGMIAFVAVIHGDLEAAATEIASGLRQALQRMKGIEDGAAIMPVDEFIQWLVASIPAVMAFWSVLAMSLNLWLAARVAMISGLLNREWPDLPRSLALPRLALGAFALATLACALPGASRVFASSAAVARSRNCGTRDTGTDMSCFQLTPSGFWACDRSSRRRHMRRAWDSVWATVASWINSAWKPATINRSSEASAPPASPLMVSTRTYQA